MEAVVKKYVVEPSKKQSKTELQKVQQSIDATLKQIDAVENDKDNITFANETHAVEIKKKQLKLLQKRKEAIENSDRIAGKKFRKINLDFLKRTKRQRVKGKLENNDIEFTIKTPLYSFHKLSAYGSEYRFEACEMRVDIKGGKITYFSMYSMRDDHPMAERMSAIYNMKAIPANIIKYGVAAFFNREISLRLRGGFSGLIPTDVKKDIIEANEIFDEVFLVKEAKWQIDIIEKDPLIIGMLDGEAYLVAHFDCTPFEYYAKSEF